MTGKNTASAEPQSSPPPSGDPYMRLHVTPLDPELLKVFVSSALLPKARNISYHTIETFPEKRYGFLELPRDDAEKLRKKLNGSILKGVKIRVERARPSGIPTPLGDAAMAKEKKIKHDAEGGLPPAEKSKKRKRDPEVLSGIVLTDGRKVKRGWTTADEPGERRSKKKDKEKKKGNEKKKQAKSKYTDHPECLVKTVLPANVAANAADADPSSPKKKEKKKKGQKGREVVIHEFEKTTKFPTFLKAAGPTAGQKAPLEFVNGKGWVDEQGNVVEAVKARPPPPERVLLPSKPAKDGPRHTDLAEDAGDSTSSSESASSSEEEPSSPDRQRSPSPRDAEGSESEPTTPSSPAERDQAPSKPSSPAKNLSIAIPPATPSEPKAVHPLEALYKRPKPADGEPSGAAPAEQQPFSFFGGEGDGDMDDDEEAADGLGDGTLGIAEPMTPFTRKDFEVRRIRSAAPTPDTARPDRRFIPWETAESDIEERDEEEEPGDGDQPMEDRPVATATGGANDGEEDEKPVSDFQKWFWEHRGDLNRAWKKRRKLAGKEKRYRENKARMARAI
ncbi:hypothetical protein VTJ83DRAFT_5293 [Remersonia thermophila]|uniref:RRM domain-containing protein n=1 Tax=Remersonia thermophila TaxID=72144 RepID=A0ABR4D7W0_9PEZI